MLIHVPVVLRPFHLLLTNVWFGAQDLKYYCSYRSKSGTKSGMR